MDDCVRRDAVPVFVLSGGQGTRLREQSAILPKPMIRIGRHPILWHILSTYAHHGFKRFVLCLGHKAEIVKDYFLNYAFMNSDFTVELKTNNVTVHSIDHDQDWQVTLADTGELTMTGARVARAADKYLGDAEHFAVTYGDGLTNADLRAELDFHILQGKTGTVLGVNPPSRFGRMMLDGEDISRFDEKPEFPDEWVNGGYFFFRRSFLKYLSTDEACVLERDPLVRLAEDRQLALYRHRGFWACMDTQRDLDQLSQRWAAGDAPWAVWKTSPSSERGRARDATPEPSA